MTPEQKSAIDRLVKKAKDDAVAAAKPAIESAAYDRGVKAAGDYLTSSLNAPAPAGQAKTPGS